MPDLSAVETKKAVCRSFTNVVKSSPLANTIDPKAFFMMLNANFPVLHQEGSLNLGPLWDALAAAHPPANLFGVFLKFEEQGRALGLEVTLPDAMAAMPGPQRPLHHSEAIQPPPAAAPLEVVTASEDGTEAVLESVQLATDDLKPFIPEELRRQITQYVLQAVAAAPVSARVEKPQLAFLVDSHFEELFNGQQFDFGPIHTALKDLDGVSDEDIYAAVIRLEQLLQSSGFELSPISLSVDPERAQMLLQESATRERQAAREAASAIAQTRAQSSSQAPEIGEVVPDSGDGKQTRRDRQLARWSLDQSGVHPERGNRWSIVHKVALVIVMIGLGAAAVLLRPNRRIDPGIYRDTVPLKHAELREGSLVGTLDDSAWFRLTPAERAPRLDAFKQRVRDRGELPYLQIKDGKGRLAIAVGRDGQVVAAPFIRFGGPDGTIPEQFRERMAAEAPSDAKDVSSQDE